MNDLQGGGLCPSSGTLSLSSVGSRVKVNGKSDWFALMIVQAEAAPSQISSRPDGEGVIVVGMHPDERQLLVQYIVYSLHG